MTNELLTAPIPQKIRGEWEEFTGQDLTPGDTVYHALYGVLTVEVATLRGTLHLTRRDGLKIDCTHYKENIKLLWKPVADTVVEPTLTTRRSLPISGEGDVW